jgi:catechol 2,3-dioxygenase-like lactoylglutathione lyase family enzyme
MAVQRLSAVRIFVTDLERGRVFYRDLLELDEMDVGDGYALLDCGGVSVLLEATRPNDPEATGLVGRLLAVSFTVEGDIHEVHRRLVARGVAFEGAPEKQPWGGTLAFPRDPDGNILTLVA